MFNPKVKHQLITDLSEARYTLTHVVDKTIDEIRIEEDITELLGRVKDLPVKEEPLQYNLPGYHPCPRGG